jgi:hypothetical protein
MMALRAENCKLEMVGSEEAVGEDRSLFEPSQTI